MVEQTIVRVRQVRVQNKHGVIFSGQKIEDTGEILDSHCVLTVRIHGRGIGVTVLPGQWWTVAGSVATRTFVNSSGFEMSEDQMEVEPGNATLRKPSGVHVVDYLVRNPRFQGIGKVTAERLWETFGDALFGALDDGDVAALADVVGPQRASMLVKGWAEEGLSNSLQWLQSFGIGATIGRRILSYFGKDAAERISENPYRLLSFSAGWSEVDKLAREKLEISSDDERRLMAAVEEAVYRRFSRGDTYVSHADLVRGLREVLKDEWHGSGLVGKAIRESEAAGRLIFDRDGNAFSLGASILENSVVDCIASRLGRSTPPCDVDLIIRAYESRKGHGFQLNKEQRDAVHLIASNDFAVVTGGAGCGKTTVLECVYDVLDEQGCDIVQLALAGKAVKRMMEATGRPAITIASFVKKMKEAEERGEEKAVSRKALVIDEASMVDLISFSGATRLIDDDTKLVLIGDPHQLSPVGPGLILHCLTDLPEVPHVELKIAKRFGNKIAGIANLVKAGTFPALEQFDDEIRFLEADESEMTAHAAQLYLNRADDSVVLCATRRISRAINQVIQEALSGGRRPLRLWNVEYDTWEHTGFNEGDLIICTRNHWDMEIQNGSIGRLVEVAEAPSPEEEDEGLPILGWIEWDDGVTRSLHEELLDSLELGYALTVHKAQGSQWQRVIVCLPASSRMIDRSLVYTAITRAQKEIVLLGRHDMLMNAVSHQKAADRRKVGLPRRLLCALRAP